MRTRSGREVFQGSPTTQKYLVSSVCEKNSSSFSAMKDVPSSRRGIPDESMQNKRKRKPAGKSTSTEAREVELSFCQFEKEHLSDVTDENNSLDDRNSFADDQFSNISESSTEESGSCFLYNYKKQANSPTRTMEFLTYQQTIVKDMFESCGAVGLKNLGNTCFINSVLQALSNTERFRRFVLDEVEDDLLSFIEMNPVGASQASMEANNNKKSELKVLILKELRDLLKSLWCSQNDLLVNIFEEGNQVTNGIQHETKADKTNDISQVQDCIPRQSLKRKRAKTHFVSPDGFLNAVWLAIPPFRSLQQADTQEFLHLMLNRVHFETTHLYSEASNKKWKKVRDNTKSSIRTIFGGCIETVIECIYCGEVARKEQDFLDLSLNIPKEFVHFSGRRSARLANFNTHDIDSTTEKSGSSAKTNLSSCSLYRCLDLFTEREFLAHGNKYLCPKCNDYVNAWRRCKLVKLPEVLCIHLLRVYPSQHRNRSPMKVDTHVDFPLSDLHLDNYIVDDLSLSNPKNDQNHSIYDLCAVIQHHGSGWQSGHYTAFCKHVDRRWYHFNDTKSRTCR
ncbi:ubiquitin carboxyl-terminal hydrolase 3 [Galdieria sulphuraria]|uniref:Ubiquitin carboxyl-terminal hydrolase n=1 Tax=Galdieria sulphuraria TaxID=130081 RepID=M2Y8K3_GALSU|nr:ubiquitin carboxyl-terminal hydrolase 3 [Galdieria sulphuraria]EME32174.1 ubiquitin carboxyl-terminal hydrolase 3 [Galdieria sulphuraria]|eukprot:XP_005708694.1 ubiquitin carboxyl-terminal hydrolase 3 [Galdieria sulphuraria]